ncbi:MAG: TlpA disulfide reductase family protein [Gammaproteobacteria bacterium]|nr:TlpA disulfide reductase family protein [Gammaproteobacteria bacterium]
MLGTPREQRETYMRIDTPQRYGAMALAATLLLLPACQPSSDGAGDPWHAVQTYIDVDANWHAEMDRIGRSEEPPEAKAEARDAHGPHPDISDAVAGARSILDVPGHARRIEAAEFLVEHPFGLSKTAAEDLALGIDALVGEIGPDWAVVEAYQQATEEWNTARQEIMDADLSADDETARLDALGRFPPVARAAAAALAVAESAGEQVREAAAFVIKDTVRMLGRGPVVLRAARALNANVPDYDEWPDTLAALDAGRYHADGSIATFFEEFASRTADPEARATARYYHAAGLMLAANEAAAAASGEAGNARERAFEVAKGLSRGVEDARFVGRLKPGDDDAAYGTIAEAEAALVYRIEHATVGGTLPELAGTTVVGTEENLSDYSGKVVLIDFWATWCGPCIAALPKLRELVETQSDDRFALLAISVDAQLEEVTEFQEGEPMPWPNWYVGEDSELARAWDVRVFPTYILANEEGTILARTSRLDTILSAVDDAIGT